MPPRTRSIRASLGPLTVFVLAVLAGFALPSRAADRALPKVANRTTLRVLAVLPPHGEFFSLEKGAEPGFDHEILQEFARTRGLKLEVVPLSGWDEIVPALLSRRGDVVAGRVTVTEARRRQIDFTVEVFPTRHVVVTRKPHRPVETLEQLRSEKVGTVPATSLEEAVRAAGVPEERIDRSFATGDLLDGLRAGRVSAVVMGMDSVLVPIRKDPTFQMGAFVGPPGSMAFGVRKQDTTLRRQLDEHLRSLKKSGAWAALVRKYFGPSADFVIPQAAND